MLLKQPLVILVAVFMSVGFSCTPGSKKKNPENNNNQNNNNQNNQQIPPSVFSVTPASGPLSGGTQVTIYGNSFTADVRVFFGETEAVSPTWIGTSTLEAMTPPATAPGPVSVRVVQSSGEGTLAGGFTYEESAPVSIEWCVFHRPDEAATLASMATVNLYGRVFAGAVTRGPGKGAGITAQVGFGAAGTNPATDPSWTWVHAQYSGDADDGENDEYSGSLTPAVPGQYDMAFRFSGGAHWEYCDLDGETPGYVSEQAARLTVSPATDPMPDWCRLQYPSILSGSVSTQLGPVYGRVFKNNVTNAVGAGEEIRAQLGFGPVGSNPGSSAGWNWVDATFHADVDQTNNDEYVASLTSNQPGTYAYAYRFSWQDGPWMYCDLNGSDDGFSPDMAGVVHVSGISGETNIDWCSLHYPHDTTVVASETTTWIFGRIYIEGVTNGPGAGQGVTGQVGYGPVGSNPESGTGWTWVDAQYNLDVDGLVPGDQANDEYFARFAPDTPGDHAMAYRFSRNGGGAWTYCDTDGSTNGYSTDKQGILRVTSTPVQSVDWCIFQHPSQTMELFTGIPSESLYGRVYVAGVTDGPGQGAGITAQFGYGPYLSNPTLSGDWNWFAATYHTSVDGLVPGGLANDEYQGTLTFNQVGQYSVAVRFSRDGGTSWTVCDKDGSQNGLQVDNLADAVVTSGAAFSLLSVNPPFGTVLGSQTITLLGTGFASGITVTIGSQPCANINVASAGELTCVTPASSMVTQSAVRIELGPDASTLNNAYYYAPIMTPILNGQLDEWTTPFLLAENPQPTDWGANDVLRKLYVSYDDSRLYIAMDGGSADGNSVLLFIDTDYGAGTGIRMGSSLSDYDGQLDNAISGVFEVTDAMYGAEFVIGTKSMTHKNLGSFIDMAGLRNIAINPGNFAWYDQEVVSIGDSVLEMSIPLSLLGLPTGARDIAVFALITDWQGGAYSNQSLPPGISGNIISNVSVVKIHR